MIDANTIRALSTDAAQVGDLEQVAICERALAGDREAVAECARVIANAKAQADPIMVGDYVTAGDDDDRDTGIVHAIDGDIATVGWDSGVTTPCEVSRLELVR